MTQTLEIFIGIIIELIFSIVPIIIICFSIKHAIKKSRKDNMSKIDFSKDKDYYRDILKGYSIGELSYIDDFQINTKREIVATLLNLKLKNKIDITENEIIVLDSNLMGLKKSEKCILQNIINGKVRLEYESLFQQRVREEAKEDELVKRNTIRTLKKRILMRNIKRIVACIITGIAFAVFCNNVEKVNELGDGLAVLIVILAMLLFGFIFFILFNVSFFTTIAYVIAQLKSDTRTEKGEDLNKKIEGLKQYIKDYSLLSQSEKESLEIWEEYLVYSVIFDINSTGIVESLSKLIEIKYEFGKIYVKNNK